MTAEEIEKFHQAMARAQEGHMSHYAEEKLDDGSFLGVAVVPFHAPIRKPWHTDETYAEEMRDAERRHNRQLR